MFRSTRRIVTEEAQKTTEFEKIVTHLQKEFSSLEDTVLSLAAGIDILEPQSTSISQSLISKCRFLNSITTENQERTAADENAAAFMVSIACL